MDMIVTVVVLRAGGSCEAVSANQILFAFELPAGAEVRLDHRLQLDPFLRDQAQSASNLDTSAKLSIVLRDNNIHDLRMPSSHRSSRMPSAARILTE